MFQHILIATDGSAVALKASQAGIALARRLGAKITAYSAIEALAAVGFEGYAMDPKTIGQFENDMRQAAFDRAAAVCTMAKAAGVRCTSIATKGRTLYEGIIEAAKNKRCEVIVMGSHGRRGVAKLIMGSVTEKVLAHTRLPVLVYHGAMAATETDMFKHILIATDGSALASKAARSGIALAKALEARVTAYSAVEVLPMVGFDGYAVDPNTIDKFSEHALEAARKHAGEICKIAQRAGVPCAAHVSRDGAPYAGIVAAAKKRRCDLVVIGSHGRRGVSKLLMGSVAQRVLAHTRLPVLVFH